jgi:hypothetical protein
MSIAAEGAAGVSGADRHLVRQWKGVYVVDPLMRFRINRPIVVDEVFDDEVVIIHFDTGNYYSLDSVGTEIWGLIESGASVGEIVESLAQRYDGSQAAMEDAITRFVAELQEEDLVATTTPRDLATLEEGQEGSEGGGSGSRRHFQPPIMSRYTDMQDLLLLDPIHEVDDEGWPSVRPDSSDDGR